MPIWNSNCFCLLFFLLPPVFGKVFPNALRSTRSSLELEFEVEVLPHDEGLGMLCCLTGGATNFFCFGGCSFGKLVGVDDLMAVTFGCDETNCLDPAGPDIVLLLLLLA